MMMPPPPPFFPTTQQRLWHRLLTFLSPPWGLFKEMTYDYHNDKNEQGDDGGGGA